MVPLQVIILALVVVLYPDTPWHGPWAGAPWVGPGVVLTVLASHACLVWWVAQRARRAVAVLYSQTSGAEVGQIATRVERMMAAARWGTIALAAAQIWGLGWGALVLGDAAHHGWDLGRYRWMLAPELVFFAPAVLSWLGFWAAQYGIELALHERALPYRLARGIPAHAMPSLGKYLSMQLRHNFYLLAPVAAATAGGALISKLGFAAAWMQWATVPVGMIGLLLVVPWLITRIWSTEPLTGPLRSRLQALAARYGVRFREVLLWKTHHHVRNAAILGYVPWARYFLLSDALLESLTDRQIEAVFAHEVGHGKHRHMWWYIISISGAAMLTQALGTLLVVGLTRLGAGTAVGAGGVAGGGWAMGGYRDTVETVSQMVLLGAFLVWGFSRISRRCEHQADWFAAKHLGDTLAPDEEPPTPPAANAITVAPGTTITVSPPLTALSAEQKLTQGADVFSAALRQIIELSHRSPDKGGWLHPSLRQRVALLHAMAASPTEVKRFDRQILRMRLLIIGIFLAGVAAFALQLNWLGS